VFRLVLGERDFCLLQNVGTGSGTHLASSSLGKGTLSGGGVAGA
jgi:hypothetical protein